MDDNRQQMKEIKFKGRRIKDGEWIEGDLIYWHGDKTQPCIQTEMYQEFGQWKVNAYAVEPDTIEML